MSRLFFCPYLKNVYQGIYYSINSSINQIWTGLISTLKNVSLLIELILTLVLWALIRPHKKTNLYLSVRDILSSDFRHYFIAEQVVTNTSGFTLPFVHVYSKRATWLQVIMLRQIL